MPLLTQIDKEHQPKIDKSIDFCFKNLNIYFDKVLAQVYTKRVNGVSVIDKEGFDKFKTLVMNNTFFAGGVFRSHFTETPINDIDIFFKSDEAIVEFLDIVMSPKFANVVPFVMSQNSDNLKYEVSKNGLSYFISFNVINSGEPKELISKFDFSFNMHYYDPSNGEFEFDVDTFNKMGQSQTTSLTPINFFRRLIRFYQEDFKIVVPVNQIALDMVNFNRAKPLVASDIAGNPDELVSDNFEFNPGFSGLVAGQLTHNKYVLTNEEELPHGLYQ